MVSSDILEMPEIAKNSKIWRILVAHSLSKRDVLYPNIRTTNDSIGDRNAGLVNLDIDSPVIKHGNTYILANSVKPLLNIGVVNIGVFWKVTDAH